MEAVRVAKSDGAVLVETPKKTCGFAIVHQGLNHPHSSPPTYLRGIPPSRSFRSFLYENHIYFKGPYGIHVICNFPRFFLETLVLLRKRTWVVVFDGSTEPWTFLVGSYGWVLQDARATLVGVVVFLVNEQSSTISKHWNLKWTFRRSADSRLIRLWEEFIQIASIGTTPIFTKARVHVFLTSFGYY